ncbi:atp4 subunit B of the stator stalk of mitochondrial F1F0 ATP synthase [Knufia obscura]|uniref:ATP synthase subunit 4 n=2 Tax=Knufia TaxID=430999 RepID=A0AAN8EQ11_9EURO|nr:atp4 subunit B of the stator stalk of mitochondrial F1F0 ATP synthase [Knufia obscura]KAK5958435.1 atp4 subunit B of the stator stalk of mitochondrial F1F0 ATP synthase [Knufia fluminis]
MASRLARSAVSATKLRPTLAPRVLPSLTTPVSQQRYQSNVPTEDPKKRAQTIIDALPGNSIASKTGILSVGTGLSIWAISNELYVLNEESVIAFCLLTTFYGIFSYGGPMYKEWSDNTIQKFKDILNTARKGHAEAVKTRIEDVKPLSNVVEITKDLFAVSKETAQLEAQAFELEQRTALAAEAKTVLDSWVRYEGQVKVRQQKDLADSVIAKVSKELENPKFLQQVLQQSVIDVEKALTTKPTATGAQ